MCRWSQLQRNYGHNFVNISLIKDDIIDNKTFGASWEKKLNEKWVLCEMVDFHTHHAVVWNGWSRDVKCKKVKFLGNASFFEMYINNDIGFSTSGENMYNDKCILYIEI